MKAGFLGRFQPLHLGHHNVIKQKKKDYKDFSIIIGSPERSRTEKNPLTFEERKELIKDCFPKIEVLGIADTEERPQESDPETTANQKWSEEFEKKGFDIIISGNDKVKEILEKHTDIEVERPEMFNESIYSGTEVRRRIKSGEEWRYLTPECSHEPLEELIEKIKASGTQYNFEPGWKKDNAYHGTAEK